MLEAQKIGEFDNACDCLINAAHKIGVHISPSDMRRNPGLIFNQLSSVWVKVSRSESESSKRGTYDVNVTDIKSRCLNAEYFFSLLWEHRKKAELRQDIIDVYDRLMMVAEKLAT